MKQLKNNKGMSLVEVMMAILIISIASILLVQSLSTVTTVISKANLRTRMTNEQLTTLVGGEVSELVAVKQEEKEVTITADGLTNPIKVSGNYAVATSPSAKEVSLRNFIVNEKKKDIYQEMLKEAKAIYDETKDMTKEQKEEYLKQLEETTGITTGSSMGEYIRNEELRAFYYLKYRFPAIEQSVIDECNNIFDEGHPNASPQTNEGKARFGKRTMYWKIFYLHGNATKGKFILYGGFTDNLAADSWNTSLVYNEADGSVYYKIFPSTVSHIEAGYEISLASYGGSSTGLLSLQTELLDTTKWRKLTSK